MGTVRGASRRAGFFSQSPCSRVVSLHATDERLGRWRENSRSQSAILGTSSRIEWPDFNMSMYAINFCRISASLSALILSDKRFAFMLHSARASALGWQNSGFIRVMFWQLVVTSPTALALPRELRRIMYKMWLLGKAMAPVPRAEGHMISLW